MPIHRIVSLHFPQLFNDLLMEIAFMQVHRIVSLHFPRVFDDLLMEIASMRVHRIVSVHFPQLFEEIIKPQLDLGLDPVLVENFSSLTCLVIDTVSSEPTCTCMSNGGTLTPAWESQLEEPISVSPTEGIPRIQNAESRTPTPLEQHSIGKIVDLMPKEEESNRTSEVIPPEYSLSALRQTPLYRYNQKPLRMIVR